MKKVIVSLILIAWGLAFGGFITYGLFELMGPYGIIGIIFYIPVLALGSIMPLYAGFNYLFGKEKEEKEDANEKTKAAP